MWFNVFWMLRLEMAASSFVTATLAATGGCLSSTGCDWCSMVWIPWSPKHIEIICPTAYLRFKALIKKRKKTRLNTLTQFSNDVSNCQREFGGFPRFPSLNQSLHLVNSHCPPLRSAWSTLQLRLMRCQLHRSRRHLDASMTLVTSTKHRGVSPKGP